MSDALAGVRFSIDHARGHIKEMEALTEAFFQTNPFTVTTEPDPLYPGCQLQYLQMAQPLPPRIAALASDAAKNLRSALDHLGFAIAVASGNKGRHAHFPFGDTFAEVESRRKRQSKDLPKPIFDLMLALKPYKGGNETLWRLNKLANINKHETIVRAVPFVKQLVYAGPGFALTKSIPRDSSEDRVPIGWIRPGGDPNFYNQLNVAALVRFNNIGDVKFFEETALGTLDKMSREVERVLVAVEAQARRLGLFK